MNSHDSLNINIYRKMNPDLANLTNDELIYHYEKFGINENRISNMNQLKKKYENLSIRIYRKMNPDLFSMTDEDLMIHYANFGVNEKRISNKDQLTLAYDSLYDIIYSKIDSSLEHADENSMINFVKYHKLYECMSNRYLLKDQHSNDKNAEYNEIISTNDMIIKELKNMYKQIATITIVAKGKTAIYTKDDKAIAINQGLIFTPGKLLFINDFLSLFGIESIIHKIDYIFFPDYLHDGDGVNPNITYRTVIDYLNRHNFHGKYFIYQIQTTLSQYNMKKYRFFSMSTTDIPFQLFSIFLNKKTFNLYGVNIGNGYHDDIKKLDYSITESYKEYSDLFNKYKNLQSNIWIFDSKLYNKRFQKIMFEYYGLLSKLLKIQLIYN